MYTLRGFSIFVSFVTLLLFLFLESNSITVNNSNVEFNNQENNNILQTENKNTMEQLHLDSGKESSNKENIWQIEIPIIGLIAPIREGTTKEIMDEFVGHFEHTAVEQGNIGLIAHNRGYPKNYFQNIKELNVGDKIYYTYQDKTRVYYVENIIVIKETDWSYLENTEDNRITLITCVENQPEYRRCIQGIEYP